MSAHEWVVLVQQVVVGVIGGYLGWLAFVGVISSGHHRDEGRDD